MSDKKKHFYKTLNNIVATKRIDNEEAYIINDYISWLESQLQQKENIIKEVREYIENNTYKTEWGDLEQDNEDININDDITLEEFIESLLEILDKENI